MVFSRSASPGRHHLLPLDVLSQRHNLSKGAAGPAVHAWHFYLRERVLVLKLLLCVCPCVHLCTRRRGEILDTPAGEISFLLCPVRKTTLLKWRFTQQFDSQVFLKCQSLVVRKASAMTV